MRRAFGTKRSVGAFGGWRRIVLGVVALTAAGCKHKEEATATPVTEPLAVQVIQPPVRKIVRVVGQPSFIQSYEHTAIYAKLTSFIERWIVDIGDTVKKDDVLATMFMPELVEEHRTKQADVVLAKEEIERALKLEDVADANVKTAQAQLEEAQSILGKYQAEVDRWDVQVKRLTREVERRVVDPQILLESTNQLKSSNAARDSAKASILAAQAELLSRQADLAKAKVDVGVARARLTVAESEEKRLKALVGYLTLTAPYDGVVVGRNANTGDFVLPTTGDPTARAMSPYQSTDRAAPIFTIDRTDVVRIFVDVPEQDANYVKRGTKATVLARAYRDKELPASVTRTSWALNVQSRTLRAEIDLHNPDGQILPGMYAYAKVIIERPDVRAIPVDALFYRGEQALCWFYKDGHATRAEVEIGPSDGDWVEITNHRPPTADEEQTNTAPWVPFDGSEQVILGDISVLTEGTPVKAISAPADAKVAQKTSTKATAQLPGVRKRPSAENRLANGR